MYIYISIYLYTHIYIYIYTHTHIRFAYLPDPRDVSVPSFPSRRLRVIKRDCVGRALVVRAESHEQVAAPHH